MTLSPQIPITYAPQTYQPTQTRCPIHGFENQIKSLTLHFFHIVEQTNIWWIPSLSIDYPEPQVYRGIRHIGFVCRLCVRKSRIAPERPLTGGVQSLHLLKKLGSEKLLSRKSCKLSPLKWVIKPFGDISACHFSEWGFLYKAFRSMA